MGSSSATRLFGNSSAVFGGDFLLGYYANDRAEKRAAAAAFASLVASGPINQYFAAKGRYPSNAQMWHVARAADTGIFDPNRLDLVAFGNSAAPKGHYVLKLFDKDYGASSGVSGLEDLKLSPTARPTATCTYAGRVFYSGVAANNYLGRVWFSRVIREAYDLGRCYQEQDPTSDTLNDLLATDGGEIVIEGAANVVALLPLGNGVVVLATNGVWHISGGDLDFSAINYRIDKIAAVGPTSPRGTVEVDGTILFAALDGVYAITRSVEGLAVAPISDASIKTAYSEISQAAKASFFAVYSRQDKRVYWFYGETSPITSLNKVLVFDVALGIFYTLSVAIGGSLPRVAAAFDKRNLSDFSVNVPVTLDGVTVTLDAAEVYVVASYAGTTGAAVKIVTLTPENKLTLSELNNRTRVDWQTYLGGTTQPVVGYAVTPSITIGELGRDKQLPYVTSFFTRTEDGWELVSGEYQLAHQSGATIQARWGWTDSAIGGRWTASQQAYKLSVFSFSPSPDAFDYGYSVIRTKNVMRGYGKSVALRWDNVPGKDMKLLGWQSSMLINEAP